MTYYIACAGGGGKKGNVTMCKGSDVKASSLKGVVDGTLMALASEGFYLPLLLNILLFKQLQGHLLDVEIYCINTMFVLCYLMVVLVDWISCIWSVCNAGADGIPLIAVVRLVKLAHCYEIWDVLDALLEPTIAAVAVSVPYLCLYSRILEAYSITDYCVSVLNAYRVWQCALHTLYLCVCVHTIL